MKSSTDIYALLDRGSAKRKVAETMLNKQSSRSHGVFCITVHMREIAADGVAFRHAAAGAAARQRLPHAETALERGLLVLTEEAVVVAAVAGAVYEHGIVTIEPTVPAARTPRPSGPSRPWSADAV